MRKKRPLPQKHGENDIPVSVSGGPQLTEEDYAIMPDFQKWRTVFFKVDFACVIITFLIGCVFYGFFSHLGIIEDRKTSFLLLHVGTPTLLNLLVLGAASLLRKKLPENDMRQNIIPIFTMLLINIIISMSHQIFVVALSIFCVPICMTTVFSSKKLCQVVTNISMGAVILSLIKQYLTPNQTMDRLWIIPQGLLIICILAIMGIVAQTALSMTEGQKKKLYDYTRSIKEAQRRAEAANIAKSAFLANMSHEIRTPINAILGMNEMILRENENEQITDYAKSIHSAGNSLLYLVNDVLDISKIESGKLEIVETNYETSSFIHDCYNMVAEKAEKKKLELKIECNPDLPSQLRGDEVRFRQVVTNLLSNAAKYTEKGSILMTVDFRREEPDSDADRSSAAQETSENASAKSPAAEKVSIIFTVKDTGMGIREENLKTLFSQFTRFDLEKNRNIEGTGLGLAISKQLVDLMHGDIQVESTYGVGSTFTVTIPQTIIDNTPMGDYHKRYADISQKNARYQQHLSAPNAKILVVDDVEVNLKVIVNLLKATKVKVDTAQSGHQCLVLVDKTKYDLIFMDHMMPEMDGIQTYAKMKESPTCLNKETPVIMLTANAISGVKEQYLQEGFTDYLSKPVLSDKLEQMILKHLPPELVESDPSASEMDAAQEAAADKLKKELLLLQDLFQKYPYADMALGLSYCADDPESYLSILQTFAKNIARNKIEACYEKQDAENYQILVHGVKSSAKSMGFVRLAEKALTLEDAARENNWEFLRANHADFINDYQNAVDAIRQAVPEK